MLLMRCLRGLISRAVAFRFRPGESWARLASTLFFVMLVQETSDAFSQQGDVQGVAH